MRWIACFLAVAWLAAPACDTESSKCVPDGPCELHLLHSCECCPADQVETCKQDRRDACATGRLEVTGTADSCQKNNDSWDAMVAAGQDPCDDISQDDKDDYCSEMMMSEGG